MWAFVESTGVGPEEAGTRGWNVYSHKTASWDMQTDIVVSSLDDNVGMRANTASATGSVGCTRRHRPLTPLESYAERTLAKHMENRPHTPQVPLPALEPPKSAISSVDPTLLALPSVISWWLYTPATSYGAMGADDVDFDFEGATKHGAAMVHVSGAVLKQNGMATPYKGVNGYFLRTDRMCSRRAVYAHFIMPTAMWFANTGGKTSWCLGPKEHVGTASMWGFVPSLGIGPEEAALGEWTIYSYTTALWEEQNGIQVEDVDEDIGHIGSRSVAMSQTSAARRTPATPLDKYAERVVQKLVRSSPLTPQVCSA